MKEITTREFELIRDYVKKHLGISLHDEKKSLVYSRLRKTLADEGYADFTAYYEALTADKSGTMVAHFIDKITTNHTFFMRESAHFDYFRDVVLPYVEKTHEKTKDVRVWCAGCSSGEEPYTLQMIMQDYFGKGKSGPAGTWDTELLATDISTTVLDKAVAGTYSEESVATLPAEWRNKYFINNKDGTYTAADQLKNKITFRRLNLMADTFPFKKPFSVICCRNVMIYFDTDTRATLVRKYYNLTEPGGYLFIGHSESLNHLGTAYKFVKPAVYRKES